MRYFPKEKVVLALVVLSLILLAFMLLVTTNTITNVSAVEAIGVGVYWDSNCSNAVSSINWGTLNPGSVKKFTVYIRNEGAKPVLLILSTANWNPSKASEYLNLRWNYALERWINLSEVLQTTLTLSVSRYIQGISNFSFDILITGTDRLLGDVNGDSVVDTADIMIVLHVYSKVPGWEGWTTKADVNGDSVVDTADIMIVLHVYSKVT